MAFSSQDVSNTIIKAVEHQIDAEIDKLDNLDLSDLEKIRKERLAKLKQESDEKREWLANGHGELSEIVEPEFFNVTKKSKNVIAHFYKNDAPRCKIFDHHLKILAPRHLEVKIVKLDAEKSPFLASRLNIKVIPTLLIIVDNVSKDKVVGFTDLGNCDDFSTEMLEWRLAHSAVIRYEGDLLNPPLKVKQNQKVKRINKSSKTIKGSNYDSSDSDEY